MKNNIILVTNNKKLAENVKSKILLLRSIDTYSAINYENCLEKIKEEKPILVFYHVNENEDDFLNFTQKVKQNKDLKTCSIIAVLDFIDENVLCNAFEKGITDFLQTDATDSEYTIRTLWAIQKRDALYETENKKEILAQLKIIDKNNNVYTENYTYTILKEESKKNWGTFVIVSPDINIRSKISPETLMNVIKKNVRTCDILGHASDFKIYLWFKQTEKGDVLNILEKIKKALSEDYTICAGYIETKELSFDKAEELANKALSNALLKTNCFVYAKEKKKKEVNVELSVKNFKMEKENHIKKLENTLSPLFYQTQKRIEEKLFETKINQSVDSDKGLFTLENKKGKSTLTISYPGYTKINVGIIHNLTDSELKAEKLFIEKDDFNQEKIEYLLDLFIKDFQEYTYS